MTDAEWLAATELWPMLDFLKEKDSERKSRLFAVACCRRIWELIPVEEARACIEAAERYADGDADDTQLNQATHTSMDGCETYSRHQRNLGKLPGLAWYHAINAISRVHRAMPAGRYGTYSAARSAWAADQITRQQLAGQSAEAVRERMEAQARLEEACQAVLLRDIYGNPFRPIALMPTWRTTTAVALAQQMYGSRDFSNMPILADALQDAGCDSPDILAHCRGPGPHVRGCWVVDLVLGKEWVLRPEGPSSLSPGQRPGFARPS